MNNAQYLINLESVDIIIYFIEMIFISIATYYTSLKTTNHKFIFNTKLIVVILAIILISVLITIIRYYVSPFVAIISLLFGLSIIYQSIFKDTIGYSILVVLTSLCINLIIFFISLILLFIPNAIFPIQNDFINLAFIILLYSLELYLLFKIRRFKNGFLFLYDKFKNEYFDVLILNISCIVLFSFIALSSTDFSVKTKMVFSLMIFALIMVLSIRTLTTLYYKHKILNRDIEKLDLELKNSKDKLSQLEQENLNSIKIAHSILHKQKSLELKLNELSLNNESSTELDLKNRLNDISKNYLNTTSFAVDLDQTGIPLLDDMFKYMHFECANNKILFFLYIKGNIHQMTNNYILKEDLEVLIADHVKNSIIAINCSNTLNRSIIVKLGNYNNYYSFTIYDSGIEFEINTLLHLGKAPITTHRKDGGSGLGFLNTFDTLKKCKASLYITEKQKPSNDDYTKSVSIIFDGKNQYKILSYRSEEIKKVSEDDSIIIENV